MKCRVVRKFNHNTVVASLFVLPLLKNNEMIYASLYSLGIHEYYIL